MMDDDEVIDEAMEVDEGQEDEDMDYGEEEHSRVEDDEDDVGD